ncbi:MAG: hypothetical protein ACQKBY_10555 [Verrucomicrobiales bacterium]
MPLFLYHYPHLMKRYFLGLLPILSVAAVLFSLPFLAKLPGLPGEIFFKLFGFATTPFCMEISVAFLSVIALLVCNHIRRKNEGDDYISLEISDELREELHQNQAQD